MQPGTKRARFCSTIIALLFLIGYNVDATWKRREDKTKCPKVKGIRNFDISEVRSRDDMVIVSLLLFGRW